jgi:hypothetical protein
MVGHSMGGIILRSALKGLKKRAVDHLHTFVSTAVPHLSYFEGMEYHVEAGLSLIEWLQPVASLRELTGCLANLGQVYVEALFRGLPRRLPQHRLGLKSLGQVCTHELSPHQITQSKALHHNHDLEHFAPRKQHRYYLQNGS